METKDLIKSLTETPGISGAEEAIAELVRKYFTEYCEEAYVDKFNNVVGIKKGTDSSGKILFAAHIDQIGFIVKYIEDEGFIRLAPIGGHDPRVLPGQEMVIFGKRQLKGIVGTVPPHLQQPGDSEKVVSLDDLYLDTGLEAGMVNELVSVGDAVLFDTSCSALSEDRYASAAMDNRAGVLVLLETLKVLKRLNHKWDVYMVGTIQEEVGTRGAMITGYGLNPDVAVTTDVTFGDFPGIPDDRTVTLGKGGAISFGPNFHPGLTEKFIKLADEWEIPYQREYIPRPGGTDAYTMQIAARGIPVVEMSIPLRYMHTTVETLSLKDIRRMGKLLALFVSEIDKLAGEVDQ